MTIDKRHLMPPDAKELPTTGADSISRPTSQPADASAVGDLAHKHGSFDEDQRFRPEGTKNSGGPA